MLHRLHEGRQTHWYNPPVHEGWLAGTGIIGKKRFYDEDYRAPATRRVARWLNLVK